MTASKSAACRPIPGARSFPDLNLRTYVRDQFTGTPGVYCFSLDASNLLAVAVARAYYHLPYYWSEMRLEQRSEREFAFYSRRRFSSRPVVFKARYRGLGPNAKLAEHRGGTLEYFLTERSCLYSVNRAGQPIRANLHYVPWPLEEAEAEIERNDLAASIGLALAQAGTGAALLAAPRGLHLATGAGAPRAGRTARHRGGYAVGLSSFHLQVNCCPEARTGKYVPRTLTSAHL